MYPSTTKPHAPVASHDVLTQAKALGLEDEIGTVSAGKAADLCVWRIGRPAELAYWIGLPGPERRIFAGQDA